MFEQVMPAGRTELNKKNRKKVTESAVVHGLRENRLFL